MSGEYSEYAGEEDVKPELVNQVKAWQRQGPREKEAWYNFVYSEVGSTNYDPMRHDAEVLQTFLDRANSGMIDLDTPPKGGSSKGGGGGGGGKKGPGSLGSRGGGSWNSWGDEESAWDAVAQMGKGKGINPMMMMAMMNQMSGGGMGMGMGMGMGGGMGMGMGMPMGMMGGMGMGMGGGSKMAKAKPGDWICPGCGDLVFARKTECSMCGTSQSGARGCGGGCGSDFQKGGSGRPGDWNCVECGNLNFSARSDCKNCSAPIGNATRMGMKSGDWICTGCGDLVFASKSACKMCGTPKDGRAAPY